MTAVAPYKMFFTAVQEVTRLSPSFVRVTFAGKDLGHFADRGRDQRIKLLFPAPASGYDDLVDGPDWYQRWRDLPEERRAPFRTYTVRSVRRGAAGATL